MCIHVITVTSEGPLNWAPGPLRPHTIHTMHISQYNTGMEQIKKNPAVQLKECRWPRIGGGLLLLPTMKWLLGSNLSQFDRVVYTTYRVGHTTNRAMRTTRVVRTTDAVTSAYNWRSNWHKFSKMFTTDRVVCTSDTDVHTAVRVNVYNWQNSAYNWQSNNYTNWRRIHLQPTG